MKQQPFLARGISEGKWVEGWYVEVMGEFYIYSGELIAEYEDRHAILPESLCYATGIEDKNGKMIWGGDEFTFMNQIGIVKQEEGCWIVDWEKQPNALIEKLYSHAREGELTGKTIHDHFLKEK